MKKYEVLVEDEGATILNSLLQSLPFVKEVKQAEENDTYSLGSKTAFSSQPESKEAISEEEVKTEGSLDELFGLWKDRSVNLDKIREQQWGRKTE